MESRKQESINISTLTYDLCLLVTNSNVNNFGIVSMQTNNTLILRIATFLAHKEKILKKQIENLNRGLRYIPVKLINAKLIVFVDSSFTNNKDLSSQLGFILMLINNLIKCKRVTRSVLASKIYGMVNGLPAVPLVVYTDSYSLYECLVKLGTTKEKRLIIDIMALRQSYERREITEI
ncbi:hypothetical protein BU23DRAFT_579703 [Bimuria novae-zelandiae CBS 107.79]|uniref:Uncharacterized protein n=1 Tax=Bimuria novae-zelandiae CBS 107.79 TaxID=1447943 RepID=A0A6A5VF96_9PLEO|nr:hypothetical protein BU23DRAFT_579703 [Bimuria novae-zelandiae CBS 107.79]